MSADWLSPFEKLLAERQLPALTKAEISLLLEATGQWQAGNAAQLGQFWQSLLANRLSSDPLFRTNPWPAIEKTVTAFREVLGGTGPWEPVQQAITEQRVALQQQQIEMLHQLKFHLEDQFEQAQKRLDYFQNLHDTVRAELFALHELSCFINSTLQLQSVLNYTVDGVVGVLGISHMGIALFNPEDELELSAGHGLAVTPGHLLASGGLIDRVITTKQSLRLDDIQSANLPHDDITWLAPGVRSVMVFPLIKTDKVLGVMFLGESEPGAIAIENFDFVNVLVPHVAAAIHNAELFQRLNQLAIRDGVTGLYNHRYFQERLQQNLDIARRYLRPFSLLMIDIDHFKAVNDTYGHPVGDQVLQVVAKRLATALRVTDLIARYGGEEFAIQLLETPNDKAFLVAHRLVHLLRESPVLLPKNAEPIEVTISVGVATFPQDGASVTEIIHFADRGLYQAKRAGRNRVGQVEE